MAMSPGVPHMGYTYLNLLDSPELLQILMTSALLEKYSVSLKTLLQQGISEPEFYGDSVQI